MQLFKNFWKDKRGNFALFTGILALPLILFGGISIDYAIIYRAQNAMQNAADAAALASAKELGLSNTKDETVKQIAEDYATADLTTDLKLGANGNVIMVRTDISNDRKDVTVELEYYWKPFLTQYISSEVLPLKVAATATLAGEQSICVIALDGTSTEALSMAGESSIKANNCSIYSNSSSTTGISTVTGSLLNAANTYTVGGYIGPKSTFKPAPITDSPVIDDPLKGRIRPLADKICDYTDLEINNGMHTLNPGTYCGGLTIRGKSDVKLKTGEYIMKDGPLIINGNATVKGDNVGFVFEGDASVFNFGVSTQINISAPNTGSMAGILFFEDRAAPAGRDFVIRSKDAERFEGTVYLPKGRLIVDKESRVGQLSRWTAIIANKIEIRKGPELEINSDYALSEIPVPEGIGPTGNEVRLSR